MGILILNTIGQWILIGYLIIREKGYSIKLEWNETFFGKVRYGFRIMIWKQISESSSRGKSIFQFNWKNPKSISDEPYSTTKSRWAKPWKLCP